MRVRWKHIVVSVAVVEMNKMPPLWWVCSLLDLLFATPLWEILKPLNLPETISLALTERDREFGQFLSIVEKADRADAQSCPIAYEHWRLMQACITKTWSTPMLGSIKFAGPVMRIDWSRFSDIELGANLCEIVLLRDSAYFDGEISAQRHTFFDDLKSILPALLKLMMKHKL